MNDIEKRARELLAKGLESCGSSHAADQVRLGRGSAYDGVAIRAIVAALTPPEGYVLVPVEPTGAMLEALTMQEVYCESCKGISFNADSGYATMLGARPEVK